MKISKHRAVMSRILIDFYKDKDLTHRLGFKGGTACYFFHTLPRFSVDLDFNLLQPETITSTELNRITTKINVILKKYGEVSEISTKRNTLFLLLNYEKEQWNIKIEISTRDYQDKFDSKELFGVSMPVMKPQYIFAHKLVALTDRKYAVGRDVFDINYFINQEWNISRRIIEERTKLNAEKYLSNVPAFIEEHFTNKNILDGVGELLDKSSRDHYKSKLLDEVLTNLKILNQNIETYLV